MDPSDNVATMLAHRSMGERVEIMGAGRGDEVVLREDIEADHKVALADVAEGDAVIKYGVRIGRTTRTIRRGEWVHLHNLRSCYDERSSTLDLHTGAPTDTVYR